MAQWIARRTSNPEAVGSSPTRGTYFNGIIQDNRTQHVIKDILMSHSSSYVAPELFLCKSLKNSNTSMFARAHYFHSLFIIKLYN